MFRKKLQEFHDFSEFNKQLEEFPEFMTMASEAGLENFSQAHEYYVHFDINDHTSRYRRALSMFILWLALADRGDYRILIGNKFGFNQYWEFTNMIGSNIEIYRQTKMWYESAQRIRKGYLP